MTRTWSMLASVLAGAATAAGAMGCGGGSTPDDVIETSDAATPQRKLPYDAWRDLRKVLRTSPDHLAARADDVVASEDPQKIYEFVRDRIAARPPRATGFGPGASVARRWDPRTTLRYGVGTPREKADLLADLCRRAGFDAEVWSGTSALTDAQVRASFAGKAAPAFAPDAAAVDALRLELGGGTTAVALPSVDVGAAASSALVARIQPLLPAGAGAKPFDWTTFETMPFVRVVVNGVEHFANPLPPDGVFDQTYTSGLTDVASSPSALEEVHVVLSYATADKPRTLKPLVEGTWSTADVTGRRLRIVMAPACDADVFVRTQVDAMRAFYPVIALDAPDLAPADAAAKSVTGTIALTLAGDQLTLDPAGGIEVNGEPVASGPGDPSLMAKVVTVDVEADPVSFREIALRAFPRDAGGQVVPGLRASDLQVLEEGAGRGFLMERNHAPGPRVLILLDLSDSIPAAFLAQAPAYASALATAILAVHPDAMFRVAGTGTTVQESGDWTSDPAVVEAQAASTSSPGSPLWESLADAGRLGETVIVFTTDGESDNPPTDAQKLKIAHGPPVVLAAVGTVVQAAVDQMASLSGGVVAPASQPADVADASKAFLGTQVVEPYRLRYRAPADGPATRHVTLQTADAHATGTTTYAVPDLASRLPEPAVIGLYVTVDTGITPITRTLAGYDRDPAASPATGAAAEVEEAMFGATMVAVEGAAPTVSAWLDDVLAAKLASEPVWDAAVSGDAAAITKALGTPLPAIPPELAALAAPLPSPALASEPTFESGPRVYLFVERPRFGIGRTRRVDLLPLSRFTTLADDPARALKQTLAATARLAVTEAAAFPDSTLAALSGADLELLAPYDGIGSVAPALDSAARARWDFVSDAYAGTWRIVPKAGTPVAFFSVDPDTGTLIAVTPDGAGGGSATDTLQHRIDGGSRVIDVLSVVGSLAGGGFGLGAFIAIEKTLLKLILTAAEAIETMDPTGFDDAVRSAGRAFACDLAKAAACAFSIGIDHALTLDSAVEAATGASFAPCP